VDEVVVEEGLGLGCKVVRGPFAIDHAGGLEPWIRYISWNNVLEEIEDTRKRLTVLLL